MSDDWVGKYAESYNQKRRERQRREEEARKRRSFAEAAGSEKFHGIWKRIEQDVQTLRERAVALEAGKVQESPKVKFRVSYPGSPHCFLVVELVDEVVIKCDYFFFPEGKVSGPEGDHEPKTLRICSDLDGNITVHENGKKVLVDESEVSEFLLKPLLDHVAKAYT